MLDWAVEIVGHKFDLGDLPKWFKSPKLKVIKEDDEYYIKTSDFNSIANGSEIREKAKELLEDINGAARIYSASFQPVKLGGRIKKDGQCDLYIEVADAIRVRSKVSGVLTVTAPSQNKKKNEENRITATESWIIQSRKDRNIRKVLRFWSTGKITWFGLYNILEIIEEDIKSKVYKKGWATRKEVERFERTANCFAVLGLQSRHGQDFDSPPKPMKLSEAESLIRKVSQSWLSNK